MLSAGLEDPRCELQRLGLSGCRVTEDSSCKLQTLLADHGGESRNKPGMLKYACQLSLDPNTAYRYLWISEGDRKATWGNDEQPYPDHPERFDSVSQVLCREESQASLKS
ncbi:hypothetical protein MATL_G00177780 [Megalops atlanticus]|uniref:SPRY-associated domain-containing protein n=1 Tax=Megalops atlanticus TaxID=7932 RepID=A0A9D3PP42_MEGAT|nr:hypothetical protein MATL_G00177780 [Megalops atlanticus]